MLMVCASELLFILAEVYILSMQYFSSLGLQLGIFDFQGFCQHMYDALCFLTRDYGSLFYFFFCWERQKCNSPKRIMLEREQQKQVL